MGRTAHIGIFETNSSGHFLTYVRYLSDYISKSGSRATIITSTQVIDSPEYAHLFGESHSHLTNSAYSVGEPSIKDAADLALRQGMDHLIIPHADPHLLSLAMGQIKMQWTALLMSDPRWEIDAETAISAQRRIKLHAKEAVIHFARRRRGGRLLTLGPPTREIRDDAGRVPDPVVLSSGLERPTPTNPPFTFLIVGRADRRKNPVFVAQCVAALARAGRDVRLRIAGPVDAATERSIVDALPHDRFDLRNKSLTPREFDEEISRADAVVCAYSTHAPNSTVAKAAALGVPVIAAGSPVYRKAAEETAGVRTAPLDLPAVIALMEVAITGGMIPTRLPEAGYEAFCASLLRWALPE